MAKLIHKILSASLCDVGFLKGSKESLLVALLSHAANTTEHYGDTLKRAGVWDGSKICIENFSSVPVLERQDLRDKRSDLVSSISSNRKTYWNTSGGSSGEPCSFLQDNTYLRRSRTVTLAQKAAWGYSMGQPLAKVWGDERELFGQQTFKDRLRRFIKNEKLFNAFDFSLVEKERLRVYLNDTSSVFLVGYVQALFEFAQYLKGSSLPVKRPAVALVSAGVCHAAMKALIEEVLADRVVNRYGSREVGNIACETPESEGLAVAHSCLLEVDTENGIAPVGSGDLLVTSLINEVMPLIRYRIGDSGTLVESSTGTITLSEIDGRTVDMFKTVSGTLVDGEFFTHLLYGIEGVRKFQVVQRELRSIEFIIEGREAFEAEEERVKQQVRRVMGEDCVVRYTYVDALPPHPSGKHRYTISAIE